MEIFSPLYFYYTLITTHVLQQPSSHIIIIIIMHCYKKVMKIHGIFIASTVATQNPKLNKCTHVFVCERDRKTFWKLWGRRKSRILGFWGIFFFTTKLHICSNSSNFAISTSISTRLEWSGYCSFAPVPIKYTNSTARHSSKVSIRCNYVYISFAKNLHAAVMTRWKTSIKKENGCVT